MRSAQAILVLTAWLVGLSGCAGNDPGAQDDPSGVAGSAGTVAGGAGTAGAAAGNGGSAGTIAPMAGRGGAGTGATTAGGGGAGTAGTTAGTGAVPIGDGSFFPLMTGNTWTFRVTEAGVVSMKTQTIGPLEPVGGTGPNKDAMAYRATTEKDDGGDRTVSWQADLDGKIVRYREQSFMATGGALELEEHWAPYKIRVDSSEEHLMAGATWTETFMETKLPVGMAPATATVSDTWRVVAVDEAVTVPAGTFDALVVEKVGGTSNKRYWFVRGVGKVKETGTQTEELASYEIME
jgi:hypothetical protein